MSEYLFQSSTYFKLDKVFYTRMLELEKLFHDKAIGISQISELVGMYARCVEYYDTVRDDCRFYYMDKIQYVLSRKESLQKIFEKAQGGSGEKQDKPQQDLLVSDFVFDFSRPPISAAPVLGESNSDGIRINSIRCSISGKKGGQQCSLNESTYSMQLPRESVARRKMIGEYKMNYGYLENIAKETNIREFLNDIMDTFHKNDELIWQDIDEQDELMNARIAKKKAKLAEVTIAATSTLKRPRANSFDRFVDGAKNEGKKDVGAQPVVPQVDLMASTFNRREQIHELKEAFQTSYNKLFQSISNQNLNAAPGENKQAKSYFSKEPQQLLKIESENNALLDSVFLQQQPPIVEGISAEDNLDSIISGRVTLKNPYEDEDDDD